jgi:carbon storage regulator
MLVLSRKIGETIRIGAGLDVVVLDVHRGRVKLGFAGPRDISIRRGEHLPPETEAEPGIQANPIEPCSYSDGALGSGRAPLRSYRIASGA